jgi:phosphatidate cytidylyltransferase
MALAATVGASEAGERRLQSETVLRATTAVALALPAAAALLLGSPYLPVFVGIIAVVMAWEWVRVTGAAAFGVTGVILAAALAGAVAIAALGHFAWAYAVVLVAAPLVYAAARLDTRAPALPVATGALYVGIPALSLLWLYERPDYGRWLVIWLIAVVIANDVAAYFVGRAVGGPKLAPRISPGKTWSGASGGIAGALVAGVVIGKAAGLAPLPMLAVGAVLLAAISQIGDLLESAVKRAYRVKDTGQILPGHGGMMDRVDGIVAALAAAALVIWIGGGDPRSWL